MARIRPQHPVTIDCDELLHGNPSMEQVQLFFQHGEFDSEQYSVAAIKRYLITPEQKAILNQHDVSIEDVLNGRVDEDDWKDYETFRQALFADWNEKTGAHCFGF